MTARWAVDLGHSLQLLLASVFFIAAVTKLRRPSRFVTAVRDYELVPAVLTPLIAAIVVASELVVAGSFFTGWALDPGIVVANVLLVVFAIAVGINLHRGHVVSCGCFGLSTERISKRTLGRIAMLLVAAIGLAVLRMTGTPLSNISNLVTNGAGFQQLLLTAALAALLLVAATWLLHVPELTVVFRRGRAQPKGNLDA